MKLSVLSIIVTLLCFLGVFLIASDFKYPPLAIPEMDPLTKILGIVVYSFIALFFLAFSIFTSKEKI